MHFLTLLPVLALLAPLASADNHDSFERRVSGRHARYLDAADKAASAHLSRREQLAQQHPRAIRKIRRGNGADGCRRKGVAFQASANATSSAAPLSSSAAPTSVAPSAAPTTSAAAAYSYDAQPPASSSVAAAYSAPAAQSSAASTPNTPNLPSTPGVTPNGKKAGSSGDDTVAIFGDAISWWWNYGPTAYTSDNSKIFVPTLWGNGQQGSQDSERLAAFQGLNWTPQYVQGFYEPDCSPPMSSAIDPWVAAPLWDSTIAPWRQKGALLISPGMCKQADETWLTPFKNAIQPENMWDITSIHINKVDKAGAMLDIDHYWNTYGKPMWVTEFACVDDVNGFTPCTDQGQINQFINDMVDLFEGDSRIAAYSMSEGMGLGSVWPPYANGQLTESGQTYLNAISKYK